MLFDQLSSSDNGEDIYEDPTTSLYEEKYYPNSILKTRCYSNTCVTRYCNNGECYDKYHSQGSTHNGYGRRFVPNGSAFELSRNALKKRTRCINGDCLTVYCQNEQCSDHLQK